MTFSQIEYFLMAADLKSFSRVSDKLFVSQPAVSRQIASLEEELGVSLFDRRHSGLELTREGKIYEELFSEFYRKLDETQTSIRAAAGEVCATYHLGCIEGWDIMAFFPGLQRYIQEKYPAVQLVLDAYKLDQIAHVLRRGEADGVMVQESFINSSSNLNMIHLTQVPGRLIFSPRHPLADKKDLKLWDFRDCTFYEAASVIRNESESESDLVSICKLAGFSPKLEYFTSLSAMYVKLQSGYGVFQAIDWMLINRTPLFSYLPLSVKLNVGLAVDPTKEDPPHMLVRQEIVNYFQNLKTSNA
jgi:DNA-binding transcriptional LysR family regulator